MRRPLFHAALSLPGLQLIFPAALAEASPALNAAADVSPAAMVLPQNATFSFQLENPGESALTNVEVLFPEANGRHPVNSIAPGETANIQFSCPVSDADLNAGKVTFLVTYCDSQGAPMPEISVSVPVIRDTERPEVEFTRQISSRYVHAGEEVTLVYQVKNTGNVALASLELNDPFGSYTDTLAALATGETQTFIQRVVMEESAISAPTLRFSSAASGHSYTKSLSGASVALADESIRAILSVDKTSVHPGDAVTLTLTLTNEGNVSFTDITLADEALGMLENEPLALASGAAPVSVIRNCVIKSDTTFRVTVSGKTDAGKNFSVITEPASVSVIRTESAADLVLTAVPSARELETPGTVSFTLTLTNSGAEDLTEVVLSEDIRGDIRTFDVVPVGAPTVREQMYDVTEDSVFCFSARITDSDGTIRQVTSDEVAITVAQGIPAADTHRTGISALMHTPLIRVGNVSVYPIMLSGVLLLIILLIMAFVLSGRRRRRQMEANRAERQKRSELLGRTNRFTPVSRKNKEGKRR